MDLGPREIEDEPRESYGFYPEAMSNHALCIRCGDCVAACEGTTARSGNPTPLALGWLPRDIGAESAPGRPVMPEPVPVEASAQAAETVPAEPRERESA